MGGQKQAVAPNHVGRIIDSAVNLQTNQSMNDFAKPILKGRTITSLGIIPKSNGSE